jgi:succinoglycan biosynthesis protein ExoA
LSSKASTSGNRQAAAPEAPAPTLRPPIATVTVIVPVRNERDRIGECLEHILAQSYPPHALEILVVDGGSTDGTREVVDHARQNGLLAHAVRGGRPGRPGANAEDAGPSVRLLDNPKGQRASGLNIGIKAARGDVIVRVDARCSIPPEYIEQGVRTLDETGADIVGGVPQAMATGATQRAIGIVLAHPFGIGNSAFRLGTRTGDVDTLYLGCYRRDIFTRIGLFDEDSAVISEDSDLNQRIREAGGRVYLNADMRAPYYPRETFGEFWRIAFRYGGARAGNFLKHRRLTSWRQTVPPGFLLLLVSLAALSVWTRGLLAPLLGIGGLYLMIDTAISAVESRRRGAWPLFPRLLLAFPCLHFGWALGFWKRLLVPPPAGKYWPS